MMLPTCSVLGPNFTQITDMHGNRFWFSYKTMVAFQAETMRKPVVHDNLWGPTTGKHLNAISTDKLLRLGPDSFLARFNEEFA